MLRALGWIHLCLVIAVVGAWLMMIVMLLGDATRAPQTMGYIVGGFIFLIAPLLVPSLIGGFGLVMGWRWARVVMAIASVLFCLIFPIGTPLGVFGLWVLWKNRGAPSDAAHAAASAAAIGQAARKIAVQLAPVGVVTAASVGSKPNPIPLMLVIAAVGLGFVVLLGAGFKISGDPAPAGLDKALIPASVLLAAVIVVWMWKYPLKKTPRAFSNPVNPLAALEGRASLRNFQEGEKRRIAALRANPATAVYADDIEAGRHWSDAQIAYDRDPAARATCEHLIPIEGAMREARIRIRYGWEGHVHAPCVIDPAALANRFPMAGGDGYQEIAAYDRSLEDPPQAVIRCTEHGSEIHVQWAGQAAPGLARFPE